ncbi:N-acetylneuraminate synthase family protein [Vampirovibrio sp.]|uniref:N-acetylneuraminate synthase family protein n=1 Tax=Vampirovibrio sp. TaxID=2717857 RepID=UPI003593B356
MKKREFVIGSKVVNDASECFVIAEVGHNHQGSVEMCKEIFKAARTSGASAVKLQKRDNKSLYTASFYDTPYNSENAYGPTYGLHREALEFGEAEFRELKQYAEELGLVFFSTAFDFKSADFLANLDIPCYKLASGDITNIPLLQYVAKIGKPMIISTGASTMEDVQRAHDAIMPINPQLAILQCTASYPCGFGEMDLNVIKSYRDAFLEATIGLSSHDNGIAMAVAAYVLGARVIEKHFTLNRAMKGTDHAFSLEPQGMSKMVRDLSRLRTALGSSEKQMFDSEKAARGKMGKKIVAARPLPAGHLLQEGDLAFKSPGDGLAPYYAFELYGKVLKTSLQEDEEVYFEHVEARSSELVAG